MARIVGNVLKSIVRNERVWVLQRGVRSTSCGSLMMTGPVLRVHVTTEPIRVAISSVFDASVDHAIPHLNIASQDQHLTTCYGA